MLLKLKRILVPTSMNFSRTNSSMLKSLTPGQSSYVNGSREIYTTCFPPAGKVTWVEVPVQQCCGKIINITGKNKKG